MNSIFIIFLISIYISLIKSDVLSFQENLFKTILQEQKGNNILISPMSIYEILTLTSNGITEETLEEMIKVLVPHKEIDNSILNTLNLNLIDIIDKITPKEESNNNSLQINFPSLNNNQCKADCEVTFENANGIFVKKGYSILNEFSLICNNYKAESSELENVAQVNDFLI